MELILVLIALSFEYGLLALTVFVVAFIAFRAGKKLRRMKGISTLVWLLPLAVAGLSAGWIFFGYQTFQDRCAKLPAPTTIQFLAKAKSNGFFIDQWGLVSPPFYSPTFLPKGISPAETSIEYAKMQFLGEIPKEESSGLGKSPPPPLDPLGFSKLRSEWRDEFVIIFNRPNRNMDWWFPPIYTSTIHVVKLDTGQVVVTASDLLFGGGVVGRFLTAIHGNNEYQYLSCGFISKEIGAWRPRWGGDPRRTQYLNADVELLNRALLPPPD